MKYCCKIFSFIFLFIFLSLSAFPAVTYNDISGKWRLMYKNNCGYEFRFQTNYRAFCIIYSGTNAIIFKGIYSIEKDKLTININEMKNEENIHRMDLWGKFTKITSSYFIFDMKLTGKDKNTTLVLKSLKTIIDGNDSNGYFESEVKVKRF
jgi:hypothetical protein